MHNADITSSESLFWEARVFSHLTSKKSFLMTRIRGTLVGRYRIFRVNFFTPAFSNGPK